MQGDQPSVWVIILNWNNAADTLACLESVFRSDYPNFHVLVVDNGSTDGSPEAVRAAYPTVTLIENGANLGYAEGNNVGIRHALAHGADYVLLLNNDTLVAPDMLAKLLAVAEADAQIGIVGPLIYSLNSPERLCAAGSVIHWHRGEIEHRGMWCPAQKCPLPNSPQPVDFLVGTCLLISRACLETAGDFDPAYYLNFEDVELGVRARKAGFRVVFVPQAKLWHKVSASLGQASPANTYYMTRNALRFFWLNAPASLRVVAVLRILLRTVRTIGAWTLKSPYQTEWFRRKRDANLLALRDFFLGRFGRMGPDVARVCYDGK
jgi:GT2 family glycosyltransferase